MHLFSLGDFCEVVKKSDRKNVEKALAVLWYFDLNQPGMRKDRRRVDEGAGRSSHRDAEPDIAR